MTIRSLFDPDTSTYTYLVFDEASRRAALIDPVIERIDRDLTLVRDLGLSLELVLDTHIHADHVTSAGELRERTGAKTGRAAAYGGGCADLALRSGDRLSLGSTSVEVRETPGHTVGCVSFVVRDRDRIEGVMSGDALFVRGTGRTDFQGGSASTLFHSIREQLFTLPDTRSCTQATTTAGTTRRRSARRSASTRASRSAAARTSSCASWASSSSRRPSTSPSRSRRTCSAVASPRPRMLQSPETS